MWLNSCWLHFEQLPPKRGRKPISVNTHHFRWSIFEEGNNKCQWNMFQRAGYRKLTILEELRK